MLQLGYVLLFLLCIYNLFLRLIFPFLFFFLQIYIRSQAIRFSYDELLQKNKEKNDWISALRAQVADLEENYHEAERKRFQSNEAETQLKVIGSQADDLLKKRGHELDEKDEKIATLEEKYSLAKYARGLWSKDQILLRFPEAKPFVAWMKPPHAKDQEPIVDIVGNDDGVLMRVRK